MTSQWLSSKHIWVVDSIAKLASDRHLAATLPFLLSGAHRKYAGAQHPNAHVPFSDLTRGRSHLPLHTNYLPAGVVEKGRTHKDWCWGSFPGAHVKSLLLFRVRLEGGAVMAPGREYLIYKFCLWSQLIQIIYIQFTCAYYDSFTVKLWWKNLRGGWTDAEVASLCQAGNKQKTSVLFDNE